jgi:hypothetical protein
VNAVFYGKKDLICEMLLGRERGNKDPRLSGLGSLFGVTGGADMLRRFEVCSTLMLVLTVLIPS